MLLMPSYYAQHSAQPTVVYAPRFGHLSASLFLLRRESTLPPTAANVVPPHETVPVVGDAETEQ